MALTKTDMADSVAALGFSKKRSEGLVENVLEIIRSCFKTLDQVRGEGAGRRKSAAYRMVCEHFEEVCNAAIGP